MSGKASQRTGVRTVKVRFLRPVKTAGRWHRVGEKASLEAKTAETFIERGLVERLRTAHGDKRRRG